MELPVLFRHRSRVFQVIFGGVVPAGLGVLAGVLLGVSAGVYYALGAVLAILTILAGLEHQDGWGGADRGLVSGVIYATAMLIAHAIVGTHAKVSLGSFPPFQVVVIGIIAMLLGALGGRISRALRERADPSRVKAREDLAN